MTFEEYRQMEFQHLKPGPLPNGFGWWFAGFVDGEGCFLVNYTGKAVFTPRLEIKLRDDDTAVLLDIKDTLLVGSLSHRNAINQRLGTNKHQRNGQDQMGWSVQRITHLVRYIVPLFDQHPLKSKKGRDYDIWRKAVMLKWKLNGNYDKPLYYIRRMQELRQQLKDVRKYENGGDK